MPNLTLPDAPVRLCLVDRILQSLPDDDAELARAWIADDQIAASRIAQALTEGGHRVSASTIVDYRAKNG